MGLCLVLTSLLHPLFPEKCTQSVHEDCQQRLWLGPLLGPLLARPLQGWPSLGSICCQSMLFPLAQAHFLPPWPLVCPKQTAVPKSCLVSDPSVSTACSSSHRLEPDALVCGTPSACHSHCLLMRRVALGSCLQVNTSCYSLGPCSSLDTWIGPGIRTCAQGSHLLAGHGETSIPWTSLVVKILLTGQLHIRQWPAGSIRSLLEILKER